MIVAEDYGGNVFHITLSESEIPDRWQNMEWELTVEEGEATGFFDVRLHPDDESTLEILAHIKELYSEGWDDEAMELMEANFIIYSVS